jgi:AcrR family transcriptional regulator
MFQHCTLFYIMARDQRASHPAAEQAATGVVPARPDDQAIPEPPWRRPRRERTPRTPLSQQVIADAALRLLDRDGLDGLSMRRLAAELGTGAASLYWHVQSKDELLELLVDRVMGEIELPPPDPSRWQEQLKQLGHEVRQVLLRHRDIARVTLGRVPLGPNLVRFSEWLLGLLRAAGVPDRTAALAGDLLALYVGAYAFEESLEPPSVWEGLPPERMIGMMRDYFASVPAARFPNVVALADLLVSGDRDERFEFGLDVLVSGLAAQTG